MVVVVVEAVLIEFVVLLRRNGFVDLPDSPESVGAKIQTALWPSGQLDLNSKERSWFSCGNSGQTKATVAAGNSWSKFNAMSSADEEAKPIRQPHGGLATITSGCKGIFENGLVAS